MKVFISWSGKRSKAMANALKDWIPLIVQHAEPFVSDKDISAGDRWAQAIAGELESSNFGILCITPENISSEWIMFEAGALSKAMQDAKVIPLLFGLELSDLSGPLQQFQALKVDEQGMLDALKAINAASDNKTDDSTIDQLVPALWAQLQKKLDAIPAKAEFEKHMRPQTEIMEDLVSQVRGLNTRMRTFDSDMMERGMHSSSARLRNFYPMMMDEFLMSKEIRSGGYGLVVVAGLLRDTMPWISETLVEAHRDLKNASPKQARKVISDLRRTLKFMTRSHFTEMMMDDSPNSHIIFMELPHIIEKFVGRIEFRHISDFEDEVQEDEYID
ncbi:MAG: toll/interleukin-1 receptor domain-containing protein [Cohaesibacter sp.]|nr:toll/interleukin-1 receptor domain-containing protein [Cohaesibacter sp.]